MSKNAKSLGIVKRQEDLISPDNKTVDDDTSIASIVSHTKALKHLTSGSSKTKTNATILSYVLIEKTRKLDSFLMYFVANYQRVLKDDLILDKAIESIKSENYIDRISDVWRECIITLNQLYDYTQRHKHFITVDYSSKIFKFSGQLYGLKAILSEKKPEAFLSSYDEKAYALKIKLYDFIQSLISLANDIHSSMAEELIDFSRSDKRVIETGSKKNTKNQHIKRIMRGINQMFR